MNHVDAFLDQNVLCLTIRCRNDRVLHERNFPVAMSHFCDLVYHDPVSLALDGNRDYQNYHAHDNPGDFQEMHCFSRIVVSGGHRDREHRGDVRDRAPRRVGPDPRDQNHDHDHRGRTCRDDHRNNYLHGIR